MVCKFYRSHRRGRACGECVKLKERCVEGLRAEDGDEDEDGVHCASPRQSRPSGERGGNGDNDLAGYGEGGVVMVDEERYEKCGHGFLCQFRGLILHASRNGVNL